MGRRRDVEAAAVVADLLPPTQWVEPALLDPNPWNINRMTDRMLEATKESIQLYGFVDAVTVREVDGRWQILDGEHRWRAAMELDWPRILIQPLVLPDDNLARKLTLVLNQHGEPERFALAQELAVIVEALGANAGKALAYTDEELADLVKLAAVNMPEYDTPPLEPEHDGEQTTLIFKLDPKAAAVVEDALSAAAAAGGSDDRGVALERICADYLAGTAVPVGAEED